MGCSRASSFSTVLPIIVLVREPLPMSWTRVLIPWLDLVFKAVGFLVTSGFLVDSFCLRSVFLAMAAILSLASVIFNRFLASSLFLASTTTFLEAFLAALGLLFPLKVCCFPLACLPPCLVTRPPFLDTPPRGPLPFVWRVLAGFLLGLQES